MKLDNLLNLVDKRWQEAFLRFVETGEAQKEFLAYLDKDDSAQKAVDEAFTAQAAPILTACLPELERSRLFPSRRLWR